MKEFKASRLSEGNKITPNSINVDDFGVTLRISGIFSGNEKTLNYQQISSILIDAPMIGFSTITFNTTVFERIVAKGFSKEDAQEIKKLVQAGIMSTRGNGNNNQNSNNQSIQTILAEAEATKAQAEAEKQKFEMEKQKIALEKKRMNDEKNEKDEQRRADKANKLREEGKPFKAFIAGLNPIYPVCIFVVIFIIGIFIYKKIDKQNEHDRLNEAFTEQVNSQATVTKATKIIEANTITHNEVALPNNTNAMQSTVNTTDVAGTYSGSFGKDQLTINIESINENGDVKGFDEVKGNKRTLTGTQNGNSFILNEPGDDNWDGVFTFEYNQNSNSLTGVWKANNGKSTKQFTLNKN